MRNLTSLIIALTLVSGMAIATPVSQNMAQQVAANFFKQTYHTGITSISLAYTEKDETGLEIYYAFNVNDGFVIVSAEDAGRPIIGYTNKGQFFEPKTGTNIDYWMQKRKKEIVTIRSLKLTATKDIADEWSAYINNTAIKTDKKFHRAMGTSFPSSTAYLVQTIWNQSPYFNDDCPGGSVTGCVATAMSQIMRYWSYPPVGLDSNSYCDCTSGGFSENYGTLSANFGSTIYNWSNMPLNVTSSNGNVATLLYDAGVSVDMDYAPSGSGAWVISADDSICAQNSYVKYFRYNPSIIHGFYDSTFTASALVDTLETELNDGRPIEYAGWDPSAGGHTWVCDGYDSLNDFHMNWGWGGQDNAWFALTNLNPSTYNFSENDESLIGIEPLLKPVAAFIGSPVLGCSGMTVNFTDKSYSQSPISSWNWSFPNGSPASSTLQNPSVTYSTPGVYPVTEIITTANGMDTLTQKAYVTVETPSPLPLSEGFEESYFPPAGWAINNPDGHATTWAQSTACSGYGKSTQCMYYNNCTGGVSGEYDQIHTLLLDYTGDANPYIYFDVAYEPYGWYQGVDYSDTLAVYYSTDCANTWNLVYLKGGQKLSTTGGDSAETGADTNGLGCFVPGSTNWRTDTVVIPAIANQPSVMFSFENRSGNGTNLYVDNINLPSTPLSVLNVKQTNSAKIYPNPNNGSFTIQSSLVSGQASVVIYNVLGQNIYSSGLNESKTEINFTKTAGIYFYRILSTDGKTIAEGKLVVNN
ncbi:MAG: C10 family peptidase [Bacteroidia bacterium]